MAIRKEYNQSWNPFWLNMPDSGTTDYEDLDNKPEINSVELTGDKTGAQLGLGDAKMSDLAPAFSDATNYEAGDIVISPEGKLCYFPVDHSAGALQPGELVETNVAEQIEMNAGGYVLPEASFSTLGGVKVGDVPAAQGFPVSIPKPGSGSSYTWSGTAPIAGAEKVRLTAHFNSSTISMQENYIFDIDLSKFGADNANGVGATMAFSYNGGSGRMFFAMLRILIAETNNVKSITMIKIDLYETSRATITTGEGPSDFVYVLTPPEARTSGLPDAIALDWVKVA